MSLRRSCHGYRLFGRAGPCGSQEDSDWWPVSKKVDHLLQVLEFGCPGEFPFVGHVHVLKEWWNSWCACVCVCASWYNICWPRSVKVVTAWFSVLSRLCCWCSAWVNLADCCIHNQGIDGPKIVHCPQASIKMIDILYYCIPKLRQVSHANHCHIWWTEAFEESLEPVFQAQSLLMTIERKGSRTVHQRWRWDFVQKWGINDDNFDVDDDFRWF